MSLSANALQIWYARVAEEVVAEVSSRHFSCRAHGPERHPRARKGFTMRLPTSISKRKPRKVARAGGAE